MEGIEQNPIVYDLMSEMAFRQDRVDIKVTFLSLIFGNNFCIIIMQLRHLIFFISTRYGLIHMPKEDTGNWFHQYKKLGTSYIIHYITAQMD